MKICLLFFNMSLSKTCGSSVYTRSIAEALGKRGHEVWIIANKDVANPKLENAQLVEVDTPPYGSWGNCLNDKVSLEESISKYTLALLKLHEQIELDIVNVQHCLFSTLIGLRFRSLYEVPLIATCHGSETHESFGERTMLSFLRDSAKVNHIISVSPILNPYIQDLIGIDESKVTIIPPGVNTSVFQPSADTRQKMRRKYSIDDDEIVLIFVGRMIKEKGVDRLYDIYRNLSREESHKFKLIIIGEGKLLPSTRTQFHQEIKDGDVVVTGGIPHKSVLEFYQAADIVLLPTCWDDPLPMVGIEALSIGLPIVAMRRGGLAEVLLKKKIAYISETWKEFESSILMASEKANESFSSTNLRDFAKANFDWAIIASELEALYQNYV